MSCLREGLGEEKNRQVIGEVWYLAMSSCSNIPRRVVRVGHDEVAFQIFEIFSSFRGKSSKFSLEFLLLGCVIGNEALRLRLSLTLVCFAVRLLQKKTLNRSELEANYLFRTLDESWFVDDKIIGFTLSCLYYANSNPNAETTAVMNCTQYSSV